MSAGLPPFELRPGMPIEAVVELLGPPEEQRQDEGSAVYDYESLVVGVQDGVVTRLGIPALD
jgi:hypothetical protein